MIEQQVVFTQDICGTLNEFTTRLNHDRLFLLFDTNTLRNCMPDLVTFMNDYETAHSSKIQTIIIEPTDAAKTLASVTEVWESLSANGATRHSLLINIGGGMVTDLGGFAAATFKRGIRFINVATTLLGAVDAAVGGKTGVNLGNLKNEIGAFAPAAAVLISTGFFKTLDRNNLLSGYAEMLKHGLLCDSGHLGELLSFDVTADNRAQSEEMLNLLETSVNVKRKVVRQDPYEQGLRKALNLGHTFGHAFESFCLKNNRPVLHGYAVAWGLVCELVMSHRLCGFPSQVLYDIARYVRDQYGVLHITCDDYAALYTFMTHDKKNQAGDINFTLLYDIGNVAINQTASKEQIFIALDLYRDLMGI